MSSKEGAKFYKRTDFKVTLWYFFTFVVTTVIIFSFMYVRLEHHLVKELDRFLEDESREFASEITENRMNIDAAMNDYEEDIFMRESYPIHARVLQTDGSIVVASKNFTDIFYPIDQDKLRSIGINAHHFETVIVSGSKIPFRFLNYRLTIDEKSDYILQIGTRMKEMRKTLGNFKENLVTAIPIILILGAIGGWLLARRSLSPIAYITKAARRITAHNLGERLKSRQSGDELDHLITTLNEMISRLEDSFKRISQFTADVSHELRTPISAMKGEAELLLSKPRPAQEYRRALVTYIKKLDFLSRMINDLILLSKFDSNEAGLHIVDIKLDELLYNLWELFGVLAEQKGIAFNLGKIEHADVLGDRTRLQQLFTNIIDNAIKFTPSGGYIDVALQKDDGFAKVSISDTGIGIPKGASEHIFERFYRVDKSRATEIGEMGLGLSICQSIVKAHHGKIELESTLGKGSRFIVSLPLVPGK
jgi:heavy metal sensor kinase